MTIASSIPCQQSQPTGIDRVALRLGLALVAWDRRSVDRADSSWEEQHIRHESDRMRAALLETRGLVPTPR